MKKTVWFLLLALTLVIAGAAFAAENDKVEISFKFDRLHGNATNQFAIWVEDAEGKYVDTVYATHFTAAGGWQTRHMALRSWVRHAGVPKMQKSEVDAVSGATPRGGALKYEWDLKDKNGKRVPDGCYIVLLEGTLRNETSVVYRALIEVDGDSVTLKPVPKYSNDDETDRGMISEVVVKYIDR